MAAERGFENWSGSTLLPSSERSGGFTALRESPSSCSAARSPSHATVPLSAHSHHTGLLMLTYANISATQVFAAALALVWKVLPLLWSPSAPRLARPSQVGASPLPWPLCPHSLPSFLQDTDPLHHCHPVWLFVCSSSTRTDCARG